MSVFARASAAVLAKRDDGCPSGWYRSGNVCYNGWYWWGRWVLTAVVLVGIVALIFMIARVSARRRKARGMAPVYGTGWAGAGPNGTYQNQPGAYYPPPPPQYSANPQYGANPQQPEYTGTTFNPNDGYYGAQQSGVQPPAHTYAPPHQNTTQAPAPDGDYAPPPGPPPGK